MEEVIIRGQYWYTASNAGYCGHIYGGCSPNNMDYTYSGCTLTNYALWDNVDSQQWATHDVFIPSVHAVAIGKYTLTYNGVAGYYWNINQNAYNDQWVRTDRSDPRWFYIKNTWLDDNACQGTYQLGFDEVRIKLLRII